jgi:hypothetical protein
LTCSIRRRTIRGGTDLRYSVQTFDEVGRALGGL